MHCFKRCFFIICLFFAYQCCKDTSCDEIIRYIDENSLQKNWCQFFKYIENKIKEKEALLLKELRNKLQQCSDSKEFKEGSSFKKVELINEIYNNECAQHRKLIYSLRDLLLEKFKQYGIDLKRFFIFYPHDSVFENSHKSIKEEFSNIYEKEIEKYYLLRNSIVCAIYITIPFVGAFFIYKIYKYFKNRNYKKNKNLKNN